jgi:hypothetical protein
MSRKVQKLEVAAILAFAQSFSAHKLQVAASMTHRADDPEWKERASRQLRLAEIRRQQKRARRAAQFKKAE